MAVSDGQPVNASVTNAAFVSRTVDSDTIGVVGMNNTTDADSGAAIGNVQQAINELGDAVGLASPNDDTNRKVYASNNVLVDTQSHKQNLENLDERFNGTTGHTHDGTDGEGAQISAQSLLDINQLQAAYADFAFAGASGTSTDVSASFAAKSPGGNATTPGVITSAPANKVSIIETATGTEIEDGTGKRVYGRLTEAAGVWTLNYYVNNAGTETAHNLASTNISVFYREVFTLATRPTIGSDIAAIDSLDVVVDIPDAAVAQPGKVSITAQTFGGDKTFNARLIADSALSTSGQNIATAATIAALSSTKSFVKLTGATVTDIQGVTAGLDGQYLTIHNASTAIVTLKHEDAGAIAADRLTLPGAVDITLNPQESADLIYSLTDTRWKVKSSPGGGGASSEAANQDRNIALVAGGTISTTSGAPVTFVDTLAQTTTGSDAMTGAGTRIAQTFTPGSSGTVDLVTYNIFTNATTGSIRCTICPTSGGSPLHGSPIQVSNTILCSTLTGVTQNVPFTFSTPAAVTGGTVYAAVVEYVVTANANVLFQDNNTNPYAGGGVYTFNGATWSAALAATRDFIVKIESTSSTGLDFSADAYIQVPGLSNVRNTIPAGSYAIADGDVLWADILRTAGGATNLTVNSSPVASVDLTSPAGDNRVVFARRIGSTIYWGVSGETGAGAGGSAAIEGDLSTTVNVPDGSSLSPSLIANSQIIRIQSDTADTLATLSANPFGTSSAVDNAVLILYGSDDTRPVKVPFSNGAYGAVLAGDCTLGEHDILAMIWNSTNLRWIELYRSIK